MEPLTLKRLRLMLQVMSQQELEDLLLTLYLSSPEAAEFFNLRYNTDEFYMRLTEEYRKKVRVCLAYSGFGNAMDRVREYLADYCALVPDATAQIEMTLYCLELSIKWAADGTTRFSANDDMAEMMNAIVQGLNEQPNNDLFMTLKDRLEALEWNAGEVSRGFGEAISELCLDIRDWG